MRGDASAATPVCDKIGAAISARVRLLTHTHTHTHTRLGLESPAASCDWLAAQWACGLGQEVATVGGTGSCGRRFGSRKHEGGAPSPSPSSPCPTAEDCEPPPTATTAAPVNSRASEGSQYSGDFPTATLKPGFSMKQKCRSGSFSHTRRRRRRRRPVLFMSSVTPGAERIQHGGGRALEAAGLGRGPTDAAWTDFLDFYWKTC